MRIYTKCAKCGKNISKQRQEIRSRFCCNTCSKSFMRSNKIVIKCPICKKEFESTRGGKKHTCSKQCAAKYLCKNGSHYNTLEWEAHKRIAAENLAAKENEFSIQKHKYFDRVIEYNGAYNNRAYIGLAKGELMENENGYGFRGVKIQSENREVCQCYICGDWFSNLQAHVNRKHRMKSKEYKEMFGLSDHESLLSDVLSNKLAKSMAANIAKGIMNNRLKIKHSTKGLKYSDQYKNNMGTCPIQLKEALINYIHRFKRIPSGKNGRDVFDKYMTIERRFGSFNNALKEYGLPTRHRIGAITQYIFPDGATIMTKMGQGLELVYEEMIKQCKILSIKHK